VSVESLAEYLLSSPSPSASEARERIMDEFDLAETSDDRGTILELFRITMDAFAESIRTSKNPELLASFREANAKDYKLMVYKECLVGLDSPGGADVSVEMLMAVTDREIAAGRMTEDHSTRKLAVEGTSVPHMSHAELQAYHAGKVDGAAAIKSEPKPTLLQRLGRLVGK
jgi:hypothetical protein